MKAPRKSIALYIAPGADTPEARYLRKLHLESSPHQEAARAVRAALERYQILLAEGEAELRRAGITPAEAALLADIFNGVALDPSEIWTGALLALQVRDARVDGYPEKWGVDADALEAKLEGLSRAAVWALIERIEAFWNRVAQGERNPDPYAVLGDAR